MNDQQTADRLLALTRDGLIALGYTKGLLRFDYSFADLTGSDSRVDRIALAAFGQEPPSYRTACFAVAPVSNGADLALRRYVAVGAPQLLTVHGGENLIRRWAVRAQGEPDLIESLSPAAFQQRISERREEWAPEQVLRAKANRSRGTTQLDFFDIGLVPALESAVQTKLDQLLREVLEICERTYQERHGRAPEYGPLYRLIFRLIAAKLLGDREAPGPWTDPDPELVIRAVDDYYFSQNGREAILEDSAVRSHAWERIRTGVPLQNLSVETLAYVYEDTLVEPQLRSAQDIHATPKQLADYVVNSLPLEALKPDQRIVFEPFSGHAPFLIAAMSRLRALLPAVVAADERHEYFVSTLVGMEVDPFAREVARYSLTLADYPNPNGWKILPGDVFADTELSKHLKGANVVLCNPPFGDFAEEDRLSNRSIERPNKAAEILRRVLEHPPEMLGFVLPRVFAQGPSFQELRERVATIYARTTMVVLPDVTFRHSEVEPVLLIAHGRGDADKRRRSVFVSKADYPEFLQTGKTTWEYETRPSIAEPRPPLWAHPLLSALLDSTSHLSKLAGIAEIHRGVEYREFDKRLMSNDPKEGYVPGLTKVRGGLEPYLTLKPAYLLIRDEMMLYKAHLRPWDRPKVIANAARLTRGPWTITAAPDYSGLVCTQRFHGVWPKPDVELEFLAAVLAGPVANTVIGLQITSRDNQRRMLAAVPVPRLTPVDTQLVVTLVRAYQEKRRRWIANPWDRESLERACRRLLIEIDAAVLSGYDLPPRLEREVLNRFAGEPRPGPVHFDRFYPTEFVPAIPLRRFISDGYRASSADQTLARLRPIDDPAVSAMIEEIG